MPTSIFEGCGYLWGGSEPVADLNSLWGEALEGLQNRVSRPSYDLFHRAMRPLKYEGGTFYVQVSDETLDQQIQPRHTQALQETLRTLLEQEVVIEFVPGELPPAEKTVKPSKLSEPRPLLGTNLNPRYTFSSFIVGQSNRLCHAAALAVSESPANAYNPLFIYGGVGLGKTHLMQSIGNKVVQDRLGLKVCYLTSEQFTNELIVSIRTDSTLGFQRRYRSVDVLLIDDIQFLIGKERTQEEFFHTFNTLHEARRQIVISSDRPPKELTQLEERLTSRFQWGLTADIKPPDYETRVAILQRKVADDNLQVDPEVIHFIAESFTHNIRDLEGALTRLGAEARTHGLPITLDLARRALQVFHPENSPRLSMPRILEAVSQYFHISQDQILSSKRSKEIATARQLVMYIARKYANISLIYIARSCGKKDHTTVMHACEKIENLLKQDVYMAKDVEKILTALGITRD